jgi:serine/threonine-protein kinase ATR
MLVDIKPGQRKSTSKTKSLDGFFEKHILGIVSHFTDIIESPLAQIKAIAHPLPERKRSIAAIGELVLLARHNVNGALPQVSYLFQT